MLLLIIAELPPPAATPLSAADNRLPPCRRQRHARLRHAVTAAASRSAISRRRAAAAAVAAAARRHVLAAEPADCNICPYAADAAPQRCLCQPWPASVAAATYAELSLPPDTFRLRRGCRRRRSRYRRGRHFALPPRRHFADTIFTPLMPRRRTMLSSFSRLRCAAGCRFSDTNRRRRCTPLLFASHSLRHASRHADAALCFFATPPLLRLRRH